MPSLAASTVNLKRFSGEADIALAGKTGCGQSTLAQLTAGLSLPLLDSMRTGIYSHRDFSLDGLRQQVVLVPQQMNISHRQRQRLATGRAILNNPPVL